MDESVNLDDTRILRAVMMGLVARFATETEVEVAEWYDGATLHEVYELGEGCIAATPSLVRRFDRIASDMALELDADPLEGIGLLAVDEVTVLVHPTKTVRPGVTTGTSALVRVDPREHPATAAGLRAWAGEVAEGVMAVARGLEVRSPYPVALPEREEAAA
jgi:hypothetical protein